MKVLLGPTNFADQARVLAPALRDRGIEAKHVLYAWGGKTTYGFPTEEVVELDRTNWLPVQLSFVNRALDDGYDVFHLWNRSLVHGPGDYGFYHGLDLPFLKGSGRTVTYSFTGYDLRRRTHDMALNPYSPFHRGFELPYDEESQDRYLEHLVDWVDRLLVLDPELGAFLPAAEELPRAIDLRQFGRVGTTRTRQPLVVHAPSKQQLKGTEHVLAGVEALRDEGLAFEFKLIEDMEHRQAMEWYRRADVVVDQLLIGWYGVLAVEAMALGKPVIAYIRQPLYDQFQPPLPIVNATPDDFAEVLRTLLADYDRRVELGERGRHFVEQVHDSRRVAERAEALYRRLREAPVRPAVRAPHFLNARADEPMKASAEVLEWQRKARVHDRIIEMLPGLRQKARIHDRIVDELPVLRQKARLYDKMTTKLPWRSS